MCMEAQCVDLYILTYPCLWRLKAAKQNARSCVNICFSDLPLQEGVLTVVVIALDNQYNVCVYI